MTNVVEIYKNVLLYFNTSPKRENHIVIHCLFTLLTYSRYSYSLLMNRNRDRQTDRQTDRQRETERDRERDRERQREGAREGAREMFLVHFSHALFFMMFQSLMSLKKVILNGGMSKAKLKVRSS